MEIIDPKDVDWEESAKKQEEFLKRFNKKLNDDLKSGKISEETLEMEIKKRLGIGPGSLYDQFFGQS